MQILSSCLHNGNLGNRQNRVNSVSSRRRTWRAGSSNGNGYTIITNAVIDGEGLTGSEFKLLAKIARFAHRETGEVEVEIAHLARAMGLKHRWTQTLKGRLVAKGFIAETRNYDPVRRINRPNVYRILTHRNISKPVDPAPLDCAPPGALDCTQELHQIQTTNTPPTPQRGVQRELRRSAHYREVREREGARMTHTQAFFLRRQHRNEQRDHMVAEAQVGMYRGETTEMSEEQRLEILSKIAASERKTRLEREGMGR